MTTEKQPEQQTEQPEKELGIQPEQEQELRLLGGDFIPEDDEKKPKKSKSKQEAAAVMSMLYMGIFEVLAKRLGDHWRLAPEEVESLAEPTVAIVEKYYPDVKMGPEFMLLSAAVVVVAPRLLVQMQEPIEGEKAQEGDGDGDQSEHRAA